MPVLLFYLLITLIRHVSYHELFIVFLDIALLLGFLSISRAGLATLLDIDTLSTRRFVIPDKGSLIVRSSLLLLENLKLV